MTRVNYMSLALLSKREKLQRGEVTIKRRSYIKEGEGTTERSTKDNSEGVVVLLIKMKLIEGEYKFYFWHFLIVLT